MVEQETKRVVAVRPAIPFVKKAIADGGGYEGDWEVVDVRNGEVVATEYAVQPRNLSEAIEESWLRGLANAEALAAELNAWALGFPGIVTLGQLCEEARRLRIEGMVV